MLLNRRSYAIFVICLAYYTFKKMNPENRAVMWDFCIKLLMKWLSSA